MRLRWAKFGIRRKILKGASHEIEIGQIWYQKKELEKLELRRYILALTEVCARRYKHFLCFPASILPFEFG